MMLKLSKNRLEAFSDGVIAIIITIMVLDIPLPEIFTLNEILRFLSSILVFFVSFFVVASQWSKHHQLFSNIHNMSNKIVWRNFLYLFFLALMPLFTKWVMQNPDEVIPAIGYDLLFLFLNISYQFIRSSAFDEKENLEMKAEIAKLRTMRRFPWFHFIIMFAVLGAIIVFSFYYPRISLIFFIALPVGSSLFNLVFENDRADLRATLEEKKQKMQK